MKNYFLLTTYYLRLTTVLIIVHCSLFTVHCNAQWHIQPSGTDITLKSVFFLDSTHGWIVGGSYMPDYHNHSVILKYDGKKWIVQDSRIDCSLSSVYIATLAWPLL